MIHDVDGTAFGRDVVGSGKGGALTAMGLVMTAGTEATMGFLMTVGTDATMGLLMTAGTDVMMAAGGTLVSNFLAINVALG